MSRVLRVDDRLSLPEVLALLAAEALVLQWSVLDLGEVVPGEGWDTWGCAYGDEGPALLPLKIDRG